MESQYTFNWVGEGSSHYAVLERIGREPQEAKAPVSGARLRRVILEWALTGPVVDGKAGDMAAQPFRELGGGSSPGPWARDGFAATLGQVSRRGGGWIQRIFGVALVSFLDLENIHFWRRDKI